MNPMMRKSLAAYAVAGSRLPPLIAVVRLYERATAYARRARDAAAARRYDEHVDLIQRATAILAGLDSILDMRKGGEVAQALRTFYRSNIHRLGTASARKNPVAAMDAVVVQLTIMTDAWRSVAGQSGDPASAAESGRNTVLVDASAKELHASLIGRSMDHAHGSAFG